MSRYITIGDSMTQATNTYTGATTLPDGGTLSDVAIQKGETSITMVGAAITVDGAWTVDTGNNFTMRLTGKGLVDGDQELILGALASNETGTSVTGALDVQPAWYQGTNIRVKEGRITVALAYDGTDPGTPFVMVTLEIS